MSSSFFSFFFFFFFAQSFAKGFEGGYHLLRNYEWEINWGWQDKETYFSHSWSLWCTWRIFQWPTNCWQWLMDWPRLWVSRRIYIRPILEMSAAKENTTYLLVHPIMFGELFLTNRFKVEKSFCHRDNRLDSLGLGQRFVVVCVWLFGPSCREKEIIHTNMSSPLPLGPLVATPLFLATHTPKIARDLLYCKGKIPLPARSTTFQFINPKMKFTSVSRLLYGMVVLYRWRCAAAIG